MRPLPGRECGTCTACCRFMPIADEKLTKPTNVLCPHCEEGRGCKVYDQRPVTCAEWTCGWKVMRQIPNDWRPNESGLVFRVEDILDDEITVTVLDPEPRFGTAEFAELMISWHEAGIVLHLETVGPPGFYPVRREVNSVVDEGAGDPALLGGSLVSLWDTMAGDHTWAPDGFVFRTTIAVN
jgi:hypothetical protein